MGDIIVAESLVKKFKDVTAVAGIDISVKEGEIYGFLGPNGAGKTTTIRMLTTIDAPTEGKIHINGLPVPEESKEARKSIGIVQQQISLDKDITVRQNIYHHALLHKVPKAEINERIDHLSEMMELTPFLDKDVINLSGGWKRKTAIVCSLIHRPSVLFLDEPTAGLDTQSRHVLWDMIRMLNKNGTTIFLTTHYIEEAEYLCDRVAIIDKGLIKASGTPQELCDGIGHMAVEFDDESQIRHYRFFTDRGTAKAFAETLDRQQYLMIRKTTLEDVFLEMTGRKILGDYVEVIRV